MSLYDYYYVICWVVSIALSACEVTYMWCNEEGLLYHLLYGVFELSNTYAIFFTVVASVIVFNAVFTWLCSYVGKIVTGKVNDL